MDRETGDLSIEARPVSIEEALALTHEQQQKIAEMRQLAATGVRGQIFEAFANTVGDTFKGFPWPC